MFKKNNYHQLIIFLKYCVICFILLSVSSCDDNGCIDSDDYGEYQTQNLTVYSSTSENKCKFDVSKQVNDLKSQGPGMLTCLTSADFAIGGDTYKGCSRLTTYDSKISCFNACFQKCEQDTISNSLSLEPSWIATNSVASGQTPSLTLFPDSEIYIQAKGNISLGQEINTQYFQINAKSFKYDTANLENSPLTTQIKYFYDYYKDNPLSIKFYGTWNDIGDPVADITTNRTLGPGSYSFSSPSLGINLDSSGDNSKIYTGIKRIFAYSIPHPSNYLIKNSCKGNIASGSPNNESNCTLGAPLLADPRVWKCNYQPGTDTTWATCGNATDSGQTYRDFYTESTVPIAEINSTFPVSSLIYKNQLGSIGGFIRFKDEGSINKIAYDPFALRSVTCNISGNCSNLENVDNDLEGRILGDITTNLSINNNGTRSPFAKRAYFKNIFSDSRCNIPLAITQKSSQYSSYNVKKVIPISTSWSTDFIDIEKNQQILIDANTTTSSVGINCGKFIAVKFLKYSDIEINQSGFIKFTNISNSSGCTLNARIINPLATDTDFFEYDDFTVANASSSDPLANLNVSGSPNKISMNWSREVFLRKGQKIRISPETWGQQISTGGTNTTQCGVGMAMHITPRPALLCRGNGTQIVDKTTCIPDLKASGVNVATGCKPYSIDCEDQSSSAYCPESSACQFKIINCVDGSLSSPKTNCEISTDKAGVCVYSASSNSGKCSACATSQLNATKEVPQFKVNDVDLCYDLENYQGAVKSIPADSSGDVISDSLSQKGLVFLSGFNGKYGSLSPFFLTKETESGQKVYQSQNSLILSENGRLIFGYLDGIDFSKTQSSTENNDGGLNLKIGTSLSFSNGQWMEISLCNAEGSACEGADAPQIATQLGVVSNTNPVSDVDRQSPNYSSGFYKFNNDGILYRFQNIEPSKDCAYNSVISELGSQFYCHTHQSATANDLQILSSEQLKARNLDIEKIRLSFKIKDPEERNCYTNQPDDKAGLPYNGTNPKYDGVLIDNYDYDSTVSSTGYCETKSYEGGKRCRKKTTCINTYANNSGKYDVMVKIKSNKSSDISKIIGNIIDPVSKIIDGYKDGNKVVVGEAERIYREVIGNNIYQLILKFAIIIMFMFYGVGYLMGVSELSQSELMNRVFKIAMIYLFTGEGGWEWFKFLVIQIFKDGTDFLIFSMVGNFDNSAEIRTAIQNSDYQNKALIFNGVDKVLNILFSDPIGKKIAALLFSGFFGWAYILILYFSIFKYIYAIASALLIFLTAKFFISILFIAGPIFILFTLFDQTKDLFDKWLKFMIAFSLQQVMVATTLAFFNALLYEIIKLVFNFRICWEEIWTIKLPLIRINLISFWTISNTPKTAIVQSGEYIPGGSQYIPSLFSILFIWLVASLMKKMIEYMETMASTMGGGLSSSSLGSGLKSATMQLKKSAMDLAKNYGSQALDKVGLKNVSSRLDSMLFDSGSIAKEKRAEKKAEITRDGISTSQMKNAGDNAVNDYKEKNNDQFNNMNAEQKQQKLKEVRDEAMKDKGKELGLNDKKIDKLMNKGRDFRTTSDNAVKALANFASHKLFNSNKALSKNDLKASLSYKNMNNAMKNMNTQQRQDFISSTRKNPATTNKEKNNLDKLENKFNKK